MATLKACLAFVGVFIFLGAVVLLSLPYILNSGHLEEYMLGAFFFAVLVLAINAFRFYKRFDAADKMVSHLVKDMLSSTHELFTELYRSSPVPYLLVDKNGTITSTNMAAIRLFESTEGAYDGTNIFDFLDGDNAQHVALFSHKLKDGVSVTDEEVRVKRSDGTERWALCSIFSFVDESGRKGLVTLVDISKQKQIDKAKTEFVSLASHQLRTPLASMKWNLELLLMKHAAEVAPAARAYIDKAMGSLAEMNMLLDDFLNASRFELGTLKHEEVPVNLPEAIEALMKTFSDRATVKNITFTKNITTDIATIKTDPRLFQMIVGNLISNAVKYTPKGGAVTVVVAKGEGVVQISVSDTGIGIPKDEQEHLFSKIFRASNAVASEPDGTGLGLYIADQAAHLMGGKITCVSELGKGTIFTVSLPLS